MLILAKLGKFYELYENDAEIAHKRLGLNYTHGGRDPTSKKMLCCGVPAPLALLYDEEVSFTIAVQSDIVAS